MRSHTVAALALALTDAGCLDDTPGAVADFTSWAMTLHPARLANAYSLAGLMVGLDFIEPDCRSGDEVPTLARVVADECAAWRHFNRVQPCLPGIASPLPMSRKHDVTLSGVPGCYGAQQVAQLQQANAAPAQAPAAPAAPPPTVETFWATYRVRATHALETGALPMPLAMRSTNYTNGAAAHELATRARDAVATHGWGALDLNGPVMVATLKAMGCKGTTRTARIAFLKSLA